MHWRCNVALTCARVAQALKLGSVGRQIVRLIFIILCMIVFFAGTFYVVEAEQPVDEFGQHVHQNLFNSVWYIVVT